MAAPHVDPDPETGLGASATTGTTHMLWRCCVRADSRLSGAEATVAAPATCGEGCDRAAATALVPVPAQHGRRG